MTRIHSSRPGRGSRAASRGYTIVEVLGVTAIIAILIGISLTGFASALRNANVSRAQNGVQVAIDAARDLALSSLDGRDTAAVFLFEPGGRVSVLACREVGVYTLPQTTLAGLPAPIRDTIAGGGLSVFVPDPSIAPVRLPKGMLVRGLSPGSRIASYPDTQAYGWYSNERYKTNEPAWLLPETGFYDLDDEEEGARRQTFIVRFEGGTARPRLGDDRPALVYLPTPGALYHQKAPWLPSGAGTPDYRPSSPVNLDHARLVRRILNDSALSDANRELLIGDLSSDTALARPVSQVAVYRLEELVSRLQETGFTGTPSRREIARNGSLYTVSGDGGAVQPVDISDALREQLAEIATIFHIGSLSGSVVARVNEETP